MKNYSKNCPNCGSIQTYKQEITLKRAIKSNKICISCANKKRSSGENNVMYGKKHSPTTIEKIRKKRAEQIITDESRKKMSESHKKRLKEHNHWNGRKHKNESRKKMRISAIEYVEQVKFNGGQMKPNYNLNSISIIEEYGKNHGYNFQHAENGGEFYIKELGYWVDAYDKEKNVVLEIDESRHKYYKNDKKREREIIEYLNCKFIRIQLDK
jgi:hypothetical protein